MHRLYTLVLATAFLFQACTPKDKSNSRSSSKTTTTKKSNPYSGSMNTTQTAGIASIDEANATSTPSKGEEELNKMYKESEAGKQELDKRKKKTAATQKASRANSTYGFYPEGSERKLTENDTKFLSAWGHKIMLNEIYARHGMIFTDDALKRHFKRQKWYKGTSKNVYQKLSVVEKENITYLINTEPKPIK